MIALVVPLPPILLIFCPPTTLDIAGALILRPLGRLGLRPVRAAGDLLVAVRVCLMIDSFVLWSAAEG